MNFLFRYVSCIIILLASNSILVKGDETTVAPSEDSATSEDATVDSSVNATDVDSLNGTDASNGTSDEETLFDETNSGNATVDNATISGDDNSTLMVHEDSGNSTGNCVHEGHDSSVPPQTSNPGLFMSFEVVNEKKIVFHIHSEEKPFIGIMITYAGEGSFTVPDGMPLKIITTEGCLGVTNIDEEEKDHVMVQFEKMKSEDEDPVFDILLVRSKEEYWDHIHFPTEDMESKHSENDDEGCVLPGYDSSVAAQTSDAGLTITHEDTDNNTLLLHIHTQQPFKDIMISTDSAGNFTIPEDMANIMQVIMTNCTGVMNIDDTEKDHVMVNFQKDEDETENLEFKFVVTRDDGQYWNNVAYQI